MYIMYDPHPNMILVVVSSVPVAGHIDSGGISTQSFQCSA